MSRVLAIVMRGIAAAVLFVTLGAPSKPAPATSGIVVEEVTPGFEAAKAGIRPGDVLVSWEREANPPANPVSASGPFRSPFDVLEVFFEQAPRARTLTLGVLRDGKKLSLPIRALPWGLEARPRFSVRRLARWEDGGRLITRQRTQEGWAAWESLARDMSSSGDHVGAAWLWLRLGRDRSQADRVDDAMASIDRALGEARSAGRRDVESQIGGRRVEVLVEANRLSDARIAWKRTLQACEALEPDGLRVAHYLLVLPMDTEDPDFENLSRRSLRISERLAPGSALEADGLYQLSAFLDHHGDTQAGLDLTLRALAIYRRLDPASREVALTLSGLCASQGMRGELASAEAYCRQSLELQRDLAATDGGSGLALSLHNAAFIAARRGELDRATALYLQALAIRERVEPRARGTGWNLYELGVIEVRRGNLEKAEDYFRRSEQIQALAAAPYSPHAAETAARLAEIAYRRKDLEGSERLLREAAGYYERLSPDGPRGAAVLDDLGHVLAERGRNDEAEELLRRALARRQRFAPQSQETAKSSHNLGMLLWRTGRVEEAEAALRSAIDDLEAQQRKVGGSEEARSAFAAGFADYYRDYLNLLIELRRERDAFDTLERFRASAFLEVLRQRDLAAPDDVPAGLDRERRRINAAYERTQNQIRQLDPARDATGIEQALSRLTELRQAQAEVASRIREASPRYAALRYPQPLDLAAALAALDPGTILLSYSVGKEGSFLFVASSSSERGSSLSVFRLSVGEAALREAVSAYRRMVDRRKPLSDLVPASRALYATLIAPAEALVAKADRVLVAPDGPLHLLPWASLVRKGSAGRPEYFVSDKPLATVASATVYAELKKARKDRRRTAAIELAAFGDPLYPAFAARKTDARRGDAAEEIDEYLGDDSELGAALRGGRRFEPLPRSRQEVQAIASLYAPRSRAYLSEDATKARAISVGRGVPLIHYACHAYFNERFPLDSALVFTIPEKPEPGQDNGLLQAWEIIEKVRIDADLVTLSACDTGLGKEMGGEGLIGLTRAFQYAGARSVLASLWKIDDAPTADLMKRFYGHLKAGRTKDEALRLAQMELLRSPGSSHPRDWAGFTLIGDGQ